jgi:A/G-specific adenine glycosylase
MAAPTKPEPARLRRALSTWFHREKRAMPWRETRDPYRIWVSEIMLQQTQVATATPYYTRFLQSFPDVHALADAPLESVLARWAGLGYYRRARFLHAAAQQVVREHGGVVPRDEAAFAALPGVGRYTVGAVLSISHGARLAVLDGNVGRVLARWSALPLQLKRPADAKQLWAMAESLLPPAGPQVGDWNQALMELGATVCTPRAPRCEVCPVRVQCRAYALGTPEAFPPVAARRDTVAVRRAVVWIERAGRVLLAQREGALLTGLYEPPGVELAPGDDARAALTRHLRALGLRARLTDSGVRVKHTITHREIVVERWDGTLIGAAPRRRVLRFIALAQRESGVTALTTKLARTRQKPSE